MKLNVRAFAHAIALTWSLLYVLCRLLFVVAPRETTAFLGYLIHSDLASIARPVTWDGFFIGLVVIYLLVALVAALSAWLYNQFAGVLTAEANGRASHTTIHRPIASVTAGRGGLQT